MYNLICVYYGVEYWLGAAGNHFAAYQLREIYINQYPDINKPGNPRGDPEAIINLIYSDNTVSNLTDESSISVYGAYDQFVVAYNNKHKTK